MTIPYEPVFHTKSSQYTDFYAVDNVELSLETCQEMCQVSTEDQSKSLNPISPY